MSDERAVSHQMGPVADVLSEAGEKLIRSSRPGRRPASAWPVVAPGRTITCLTVTTQTLLPADLVPGGAIMSSVRLVAGAAGEAAAAAAAAPVAWTAGGKPAAGAT